MPPRTFAVLVAFLALAQPVAAGVKVSGVFSDHMVLQADLAAPVFGKAEPDEAVTVEIGDQKKSASADKDGNWLVKLDPLKAGGPFELKITGKNAVAIKDVLVGEVWIASGQSNMRFPLARTTSGKEEVAAANHPQIRYLIGVGKWDVCNSKTAGNYSGVAYHFAVELQKARKVPVGIIDNSVSGALGQAFMSPAGIDANPDVVAYVKKYGEGSSDIWKASFAPIIPYGIRGALWYQGEGNRDYPVSYAKLLPALIADWRMHWGQGDFPFLIVQLANYQDRKPDPWEGKDCALREAQMKTAKAGKNTALVVTIDLGIPKDVHYPDKKPVGQRLSLAARGVAYGEKIEYSGPIFESAKFENGKVVVSFTHVGGGLAAKGEKLMGFLLCGADKKFVRAEATIEGEKVIVTSDKVPNPIAVRYAWERNPECNLANKDGLPASPFRSDDFVNFFTKDGG